MDKETVKLLLESYRPADAGDPVFAEALREVAADPELAAWFEEVQRFDAVLSTHFQRVPVPPDVKSHILLGFQGAAPARRSRPRFWMLSGAIAALLALAAFSLLFFYPRETPAARLAGQAISFTENMPALQFVCFDAAEVAAWINAQPGSQKVGLRVPPPDKTLSMAMIGSSMVEWNGRPVVMVCLQDGRHMAMLYVLKASDAPAGLPEGSTETVTKANWVVRTTRQHDQVQLLTVRGRPEDLDFPRPF